MNHFRKSVLIMMALLLGTIVFTGCGDTAGNKPDAGSLPVATMEPVESVSPDSGSAQGSEVLQEPVVSEAPDAGQVQEETPSIFSFSWQELYVTAPTEWGKSCLVTVEEDGFAIYQKASYEKDKSGFLCRFLRTEEYFNHGAGETLLAYTDNGELYYLIEPTDVNCVTEDEAILNEYIRLHNELGLVVASLEIDRADVHRNVEEYVLPISSIRPITRDMLLNFSDNDLWIARNEIYARHGREFTNGYLAGYFERMSWYEGTIPAAEFDDNVLSQIERDNIAVLTAAEAEYDAKHPYPKQCKATDTIQADLHCDGTDNTIGYSVEYLKNADAKCYITVDGTTYCASDLVSMWNPREDVFYIADILEWDGVLEIAVLDDGPSADPITYFFRLEESLSYIGKVSGYPFPQESNGLNGFIGQGIIEGTGQVNLIETAPLKNYWRYDPEKQWIVYQDSGWYEYGLSKSHELYMDLPVRKYRDVESALTVIPAQAQVYFIGTDNWEWILVKGKDGEMGYMQVKDGIIVELDKPAQEVFSDLYFYG